MAESFQCPSGAIREALDAVKPATQPSHPRFGFVLIGGGTVEAYRGDLRIAVRVPETQPLEPVMLPHARLHAVMRECVGDVQIARQAGKPVVTVRGSGGRWTLYGADSSEWTHAEPARQRPSPVCRLPADQLSRCLSSTIDAAGEEGESSRAQLHGVRIEVADGKVFFVATDGRRLHVSEADIDQSVDDCGISIPAGVIRVVLAAARGVDGRAVQLLRTASDAIWTIGPATITARLLAGDFVQWRKVIPQGRQAGMMVQAAALLSAVRQAEVVTTPESRAVAFRFGAGRVCLAARSAEYGSATVACPAVGAPLEAAVKLDPRHVRQWLAALDGDATVSVDPGDGETAVLLRHDDAMAVVMPMTVEGEYEFADV